MKTAVDACRHRRASEQRDELRLPTAYGLSVVVAMRGRGQLHGVSGVENHGRELPHDGERAHVDHQIVVAEARAALGDEDALVAGSATLFDGVPHVPGRDELAFLDVHYALA